MHLQEMFDETTNWITRTLGTTFGTILRSTKMEFGGKSYEHSKVGEET